jgi:tRNA A-37 threonylcarbamoyl transferase component Bud32
VGTALRLGDEIGAGAIATVVRVHGDDGQVLAGKILHTSRDLDPRASERFAREAEVVRDVEHPNVVRVHGLRPVEGQTVLLMELVDGPALDAVLARDAPLTARRVIDLARGIAAGLSAAHAAGVIHRDLKPGNILVAEGDTPKIADFGMARASSFAGVDARDFAVLGTPDYMAPEALDPLAVDARTDLYALGCIMFEMATGRPPYAGATAFGVIEQHRSAPIPRIDDAAGYPAPLRQLIESLLEKKPADRPQSASAVVHALDRITADTTSLATVDDVGVAVLSEGRCARCGAPMVPALGVCLSCRLPAPRVSAGEFTVFVTGPGKVADKLDADLRAKLVDWIRSNPSLGLSSARLETNIPRVPFALATGIDQRSAEALVASMRVLGLEATHLQGGSSALPAVRKKARTVAGRMFLIIAASSASMGSFVGQLGWLWLLYPLLWLAIPAVFGARTLRPATTLERTAKALPPALAARIAKIAQVGGSLDARRHRESLRGAVSRALQLREATPQAQRPEIDPEIGEALDVALVAAGRLDELDRRLERADLREASAEVHALMRERDTWSARLLDLTATLESFKARLAAASGRARPEEDELLEDLRAKVEALEEVQAS